MYSSANKNKASKEENFGSWEVNDSNPKEERKRDGRIHKTGMASVINTGGGFAKYLNEAAKWTSTLSDEEKFLVFSCAHKMPSSTGALSDWRENQLISYSNEGEFVDTAPYKKLVKNSKNLHELLKKKNVVEARWGPIILSMKSTIRSDMMPHMLAPVLELSMLHYQKAMYMCMSFSEVRAYVNMRFDCIRYLNTQIADLGKGDLDEYARMLGTKRDYQELAEKAKGMAVNHTALEKSPIIAFACYLPDYKCALLTQDYKTNGSNKGDCEKLAVEIFKQTLVWGESESVKVDKGTDILDKEEEIVKRYRIAQANINKVFAGFRKIGSSRTGGGPDRGDKLMLAEEMDIIPTAKMNKSKTGGEKRKLEI
jgi:hypothetical protein